MAENTRLPTQPRDPFDRFDEAISDPRLYEADQARYEQLRYEPQPRYEQPRYEQPQYEQPFALQYERNDMLPEVELFDVQQGKWVRLQQMFVSSSYKLANPQRYYNPAGRQVLVRFVNNDPQNQIGFSFQIALAGVVR